RFDPSQARRTQFRRGNGLARIAGFYGKAEFFFLAALIAEPHPASLVAISGQTVDKRAAEVDRGGSRLAVERSPHWSQPGPDGVFYDQRVRPEVHAGAIQLAGKACAEPARLAGSIR